MSPAFDAIFSPSGRNADDANVNSVRIAPGLRLVSATPSLNCISKTEHEAHEVFQEVQQAFGGFLEAGDGVSLRDPFSVVINSRD